ncbi:MAG: NAD(P)/FAD-dependent oxidoreductase [Pseudomonadota bacterium]
MDVEVDIAIVGAGPVGLFAVFACGQLGMISAVIDALDDPGGQLTALYPEKPIYDIPGRPAIRADALVADLMAQAAPYEPIYLLGQQTADLCESSDGTFTLTTAAGTKVRARAILVAAGVGAFGPNRPPLDHIRDFEGTSVFYHVGKRETFKDRQLVIAGGGDSAVDWALSLADIAKSITVVHRRDSFRAHPANVAAMHADDRVNVRTPCQLKGLEGENGKLTGIHISEIGGDPETIKADALLALFGLAGDLSPLKDWGVEIERKSIPVDPATLQTSRPGIHAIGDVADYPGKRKLILTGFAEAAAAAHAAHARVFPGKAIHDEYSTTRGVPGQTPDAAQKTA